MISFVVFNDNGKAQGLFVLKDIDTALHTVNHSLWDGKVTRILEGTPFDGVRYLGAIPPLDEFDASLADKGLDPQPLPSQ